MFYSLILQALTPVPLQDDEIAALANAQHAAKQKVLVVSSSPATSSAAPVSTLRTVLTTGLRPQQLLLQPMQPPAYRVVTQTSSNTVASANPATIIPDNDPSLDENLLNILAADGDDDDPMEDHYRRHRGERPLKVGCEVVSQVRELTFLLLQETEINT